MGRDLKIAAYENSVRSLLDDMHRVWERQGRPANADAATDELLQVVSLRLGDSILEYDEQSRIPLSSPSPSFAVGDFVAEVRAAYIRVAEDYAGRWEAAAIKEDAIDLLRQLSKPSE